MLFYYDKFINGELSYSSFVSSVNKDSILETMRQAFPIICSLCDIEYLDDNTDDITNFCEFKLEKRVDVPEGHYKYRSENNLKWRREIENGFVVVESTMHEDDIALFLKTEDRNILNPISPR